MEQVKKGNRFSNFEMLRIVLIIYVIILHFNDTSRMGALSFIRNASFSNKIYLYLLESFTICAVNTFVLLSGYFMTTRKSVSIRKVIDLFISVVFYSVFTYLVCLVITHDFSIKHLIASFIPSNYYAWLYCSVFLLAPFLNLIMESIDDDKLNLFLILLLILFSIIPTLIDFVSTKIGLQINGLSTVSKDGNGKGFTLINFIMMYFIGGYLARKKIDYGKYNILGYIICSLIVFIGLFINRKHSLDYCNFFVVLQSIFFFGIFNILKFKNRIINFFAKSVWGIFIIHGSIINIISNIFKVEKYVKGSFLSLFIYSLICIISVFFISLILEKIFSIFILPINFVVNKIPILNIKITSKEE